MIPDFIESYLGMRVESVDEVEIIRRMTEGIYDHEEFEKALKWAKETCKIGLGQEPARTADDTRSRKKSSLSS